MEKICEHLHFVCTKESPKEAHKGPPRNQVSKAEPTDQWKPGFCRDCFKHQRIYFPWRSHGFKCSHAATWESSKQEEKPSAGKVNWSDPEEANWWIDQLPNDIAEDIAMDSIVH